MVGLALLILPLGEFRVIGDHEEEYKHSRVSVKSLHPIRHKIRSIDGLVHIVRGIHPKSPRALRNEPAHSRPQQPHLPKEANLRHERYQQTRPSKTPNRQRHNVIDEVRRERRDHRRKRHKRHSNPRTSQRIQNEAFPGVAGLDVGAGGFVDGDLLGLHEV